MSSRDDYYSNRGYENGFEDGKRAGRFSVVDVVLNFAIAFGIAALAYNLGYASAKMDFETAATETVQSKMEIRVK